MQLDTTGSINSLCRVNFYWPKFKFLIFSKHWVLFVLHYFKFDHFKISWLSENPVYHFWYCIFKCLFFSQGMWVKYFGTLPEFTNVSQGLDFEQLCKLIDEMSKQVSISTYMSYIKSELWKKNKIKNTSKHLLTLNRV